MVHSGSASPMTTTPSASPHLTVPATATPLVPPPGDSTGQDLTQPSAKLLSNDLTDNSDATQSSAPFPAVAEPHVVTTAKALNANSSPISSQASPQTKTRSQGPINGRTSGRKRTPKACDCCGPNGTGHNVKTSSRGRGKGKGTVQDLRDTPKRKANQLTHINNTALTKKKVQESEDETKAQKKVPKETVVVADTQPHTNAPLSVTSLQDVSKMDSAAPENEGSQKKEDTLIKGSGVLNDGAKLGGGKGGLEIRVSGNTGRSATAGRGRGLMGTKFASNMKVDIGIKKWGDGVFVIGSKMNFPAPLVVVQSREKSKGAELECGAQTHSSMISSSFGNGETVNLSDSEPEGDDNTIMSEQGNGSLSFPEKLGTRQDHESEMQVDQKPGETDNCSSLIPLSNGVTTTPTDHSHSSTHMEVECDRITVISIQHHWALRDHRLYCRAGTWENNSVEDMSDKPEAGMDGKTQNEEREEQQLVDMVHEFLESFYLKYGSFIPLTETDVVEHLKKNSDSDFSKWGLDIKGEMTRYRSGLASAPIAGFMVMHNKHTLSLEDLGTLEEQNWLNDQIINMYGELIMEATQHKVHFFNSFFHKQLVAKGYEGVKRWTKKVDLFSKWLLLIPIHLEIHWSLVTVTMATKTISYYDSQGIVFRHTTDNIMKYLQSEAREKEQTAFQKGWKITIIKGIPQQKNDSDCGVFVLEYCRRLSVKQPLLFSQEDMPRIRKRIYKELCDCRLND